MLRTFTGLALLSVGLERWGNENTAVTDRGFANLLQSVASLKDLQAIYLCLGSSNRSNPEITEKTIEALTATLRSLT
jgi:hypothetical protein